MAITHVQSTGADAQASAIVLAYGSNVGTGNTLFAVCGFTENGVYVSTITDTQGHTWALLQRSIGANRTTEIWWARNTTTGANTVTVTFGAAKSGVGLTILEYSGLGVTGTLLDQSSSSDNTVAGLSHPLGSITTTTANQLIFGLMRMGNSGTFVLPGDYTSRRNTGANNSVIVMDRIVTATETTTPTITSVGNTTSHGQLLSLKESGVAGGSFNALLVSP
jgi:hypothetical protein